MAAGQRSRSGVAGVHQGNALTELWTVEQAAAYWQVSPSRARAILADRNIKRVSGYPFRRDKGRGTLEKQT